MAHGGMTQAGGDKYKEYLAKVREDFIVGVSLLSDDDLMYMADKIEEARWVPSPVYNRGVHILLDMVQYAVEASYASPNLRK